MKKAVIIILSLLSIIACCFGVAACAAEQKPQEEQEDTAREVQLSAPDNFTMQDEVLSWDNVENADYYLLQYDGKTINLMTNSYKLSGFAQSREVVVQVRAASFNKNYLKSEWSQYTYNYVYVKEETPTAALKYTLLEDGSGYEVTRANKDVTQGLEGRVVIPDNYNGLPVKKIADYAFYAGDGGLIIGGAQLKKNNVTTSIKLPKYLEEIGDSAFRDCIVLGEIELPQGLKSIGESAFNCCDRLSSVNIPNGITEIQNFTFGGCKTLTNVSIPNTVNSIGNSVFGSCSALAEIQLPDNLTKMGYSVFSNCVSLKEIVIPESVTEIGDYVFNNCTNLSKITLPKNIKDIGKSVLSGTAWYNSKPDGFIIICEDILYEYKGEPAESAVLEIPSHIRYIASGAFSDKKNLVGVNIPEGVTKIGQEVFARTALESVVLPESVTEIGAYVFISCHSLASVKLPSGLKIIPRSIFSDCRSLRQIDIPAGVTEIESGAFELTALESVALPAGVTKIGERAFSYTKLKSIVIPSAVTEIGAGAFRYTTLEYAVIPSSVTSIGDGAFYDMTSTDFNVYYYGTAEQWANIEISSHYTNYYVNNRPKFYYSESAPEEEGNYWHYVDDGAISIW